MLICLYLVQSEYTPRAGVLAAVAAAAAAVCVTAAAAAAAAATEVLWIGLSTLVCLFYLFSLF